MKRTWYLALPVLAALTQAALAQDAKAVIAAASKAMGVDGLNSVQFYGTAQTGNLGQNNNASQPWPLTGANDYVRAIDFTVPSSRATWNTYTMTVQGAAATLVPVQQLITPQNANWGQQLDIWTTPWGFLKGAAANGATVKSQNAGGKKTSVVTFNSPMKSPGGASYKVVGYINAQNQVERVQTWVENPIFGDMLVDNEFSFYRQGPKGLMYPAQIVQKRGGWPVFSAYILGAVPNPGNLADLMKPNPAPAGPPPAPPAGPTSEKLADGVWRINGAYNALAVEMADHIVLYEPGLNNEARAQAVIAEVHKVIPNKPIRYGVISHHHFDHTSGLPVAVAEGITIVTPEVNRDFLMNALSQPRTLAPDAMSKSGKKPVIEGFKGDKRVFQDATRTFEIHVIKDLPHADGLVIGWLPKEKILVFADMFGLPPANNPVPNPPVVGTQVFLANIERLGLDPEKILSVHVLNPNRLATMQDIRASLGLR
jgi:glyoxylase-like metal-dependent hydrolase (beta-lactamase superfamily II)